MPPIISVSHIFKNYASGFQALKDVNLEIRRGEIFGLLGPNGAGKTTLIGIICGLVNPSAGAVSGDGHDIRRDYRVTRSMIGLVPQELTTDAFETVWATVSFSRGLFGKPANPGDIEKALKDGALWDRKDMWQVVRSLRESGVTIILTTHYIEEAEDMADRIGVIHKGEIILVEDKTELIHKPGKKQLTLQLHQRLETLPPELAEHNLALEAEGHELVYTYDSQGERTGITGLLQNLNPAGVRFKDLHTTQSSLEDIFVDMVRQRK